jgi:hypothetical protein
MFKGGTTMFLSRVIERLGQPWSVIGFDSFAGFPPRRSALDMYDHPDCVFTDLEAVRRHVAGRAIESRRAPVPRPGVYELYWYYASERQAMFERRTGGLEPPWTADPILQTYKFCNVFRAADRVSQYMIRTVCYPDDDCTPADLLFRIVAFRTFSKIETWETVQRCLGRQPVLDDLADGRFSAALEATRAENLAIYTTAFILCASDAYGQRLKHLNHVELFRHMFLQQDLAEDLRTARSLADVYHLLHAYPLMGDFMSYQTAIDLNYSPIINFSENDFTQPGPGALRGIRKCFTDLGDYKPSELITGWWTIRRTSSGD